MSQLNLEHVRKYINSEASEFHRRRIGLLKGATLEKLLNQNPFLLRANNFLTAGALILHQMEAYLSSGEEEIFNDFLRRIAVLIAQNAVRACKTAVSGVDFEFVKNDIHYVVAVKSEPNWGNDLHQSKLEHDFKNAVARIKESNVKINVQPVLGVCYGKAKTCYLRGYLKVVGQNFWYLISGNKDLYTEIMEPIGYRANEHTEAFDIEKSNALNRVTKQFLNQFCNDNGAINWVKVVEFSSGNDDLEKFLP